MKNDLLIVSSFKNAKLYQLLEGLPFSRRELCELLQIGYPGLSGMLTLRFSPLTPRGLPSQTCQKLADYFNLDFEELFPAALYSLRLPNQILRSYDSERILPLLEARRQHLLPEFTESTAYDDLRRGELRQQIKNVFSTLTQREGKIARLFWGLDGGPPVPKVELEKIFHISSARIGQIIARILAKLRHPSRSSKLREYLVESTGGKNDDQARRADYISG